MIENLKALVVGYGSIGQRHSRLLRDMGMNVSIVSRREIPAEQCFSSVAEALATGAFDYVVVANETADHAAAVDALLGEGYSGRVLIEKPVSSKVASMDVTGFAGSAVGYNLRFHPVLSALHDALARKKLLSMQIYCGQYLPTWREGRDYRRSYSAQAQGGGALRDLSHELDYALWLGGAWKRVAALGGHVSNLEIESDDSFMLLLELERCSMATVQVNYLDRPGRREIVVNAEEHTYRADLVQGILETDGVACKFSIDRDATMIAQHRAALASDYRLLCTLAEGEAVVRLIDAANRAVADKIWVVA